MAVIDFGDLAGPQSLKVNIYNSERLLKLINKGRPYYQIQAALY